MIVTTHPIEQFRAAMLAAGLTPPDEIHADGGLHRFASNGRRGDDSGWYVLHLDSVPAGAFGCWREGLMQQWCSKTPEAMTAAEREAHRQTVQAMRQQREADTAQRQRQAAQVAALSLVELHPPIVRRRALDRPPLHIREPGCGGRLTGP